MSGYPYDRRPRPQRGRRSSMLVCVGLLVVTLAVVFTLGVALGEALHQDGPHKGETVTSLRTLTSLPRS